MNIKALFLIIILTTALSAFHFSCKKEEPLEKGGVPEHPAETKPPLAQPAEKEAAPHQAVETKGAVDQPVPGQEWPTESDDDTQWLTPTEEWPEGQKLPPIDESLPREEWPEESPGGSDSGEASESDSVEWPPPQADWE